MRVTLRTYFQALRCIRALLYIAATCVVTMTKDPSSDIVLGQDEAGRGYVFSGRARALGVGFFCILT